MTTDIRIYAAGTINYLVNSSGTPTAGGSATAVSTTPFALLNDQWTMQVAQPDAVYQGGPPFRLGSTLAYQSYGNTQQQIPFSVAGSSHDNVASLLRVLRQLINTNLHQYPAILYYKPNGATNVLYFEILSGVIQERPGPLNPTAGFTYVEADMTLTLSPFGGATSLETIYTNTVFTNNGTSNISTFGASLTGDLITEGQPLNLKIDGPSASTTDVGKIWLATADSRIKTTHTTTVSTSASTSGTSTTAINISTLLNLSGANLAVFVRFSSVTAGNKALYATQLQLHGGGVITPVTAWQPMPVTSGTTMVFAGVFNLTGQRVPVATTLNVDLIFWLKSTDGTAVAYTVDYSESVLAYTVAELTAQAATYGNSTGILYTLRATNINDPGAWLPTSAPRAYSALSGGVNANYAETVRGELPIAYSGSPAASLWAAWIKDSGVHTTTDTLRMTPQNCALFFAMRGNG